MAHRKDDCGAAAAAGHCLSAVYGLRGRHAEAAVGIVGRVHNDTGRKPGLDERKMNAG